VPGTAFRTKPKWRRLAALLTLLVVGLACSRQPVPVQYLDLLASGAVTSRSGLAQRAGFDETWWTLELQTGEEAGVALDLAHSPVLEVTACAPQGGEPSLLTCLVTPDGGDRPAAELVLPLESGWCHGTLDLAGYDRQRVRLSLRFNGNSDQRALVRELHIRQRLASTGEAPPEPPLQILFISVDTLRWDAVFGDQGAALMPNLARLAGESEVWRSHYAAATWTKPSHASMLTGYAPDTHGAVSHKTGIDADVPTLAERLKDQGLATGGLVYDCVNLSARWGFHRGFDEYRIERWRTPRLAREALNWMVEQRSEPFFFFLHTFEPHSDRHALPYEAPGVTRQTVQQRFGMAGYGCREQRCASVLLKAFNKGWAVPRTEDPEVLLHLYQQGVSATDQALGQLMDDLKSSGLWHRLMVLVTSDHGEEFGEHGKYLHSTLYDPVIRVPLLVKPWPVGRWTDSPAGPWAAGRLMSRSPPAPMPGRSS